MWIELNHRELLKRHMHLLTLVSDSGVQVSVSNFKNIFSPPAQSRRQEN